MFGLESFQFRCSVRKQVDTDRESEWQVIADPVTDRPARARDHHAHVDVAAWNGSTVDPRAKPDDPPYLGALRRDVTSPAADSRLNGRLVVRFDHERR